MVVSGYGSAQDCPDEPAKLPLELLLDDPLGAVQKRLVQGDTKPLHLGWCRYVQARFEIKRAWRYGQEKVMSNSIIHTVALPLELRRQADEVRSALGFKKFSAFLRFLIQQHVLEFELGQQPEPLLTAAAEFIRKPRSRQSVAL